MSITGSTKHNKSESEENSTNLQKAGISTAIDLPRTSRPTPQRTGRSFITRGTVITTVSLFSLSSPFSGISLIPFSSSLSWETRISGIPGCSGPSTLTSIPLGCLDEWYLSWWKTAGRSSCPTISFSSNWTHISLVSCGTFWTWGTFTSSSHLIAFTSQLKQQVVDEQQQTKTKPSGLQRLCHVPTLRLLAHLNVCLVWLANGVYTCMVLSWNCRYEWKIDRENMMNRSLTRVNLVRIHKAFTHNFNHETDSNKQNKRKAHQLAKWAEPGFTLNTFTYFWRGT